MNVETLIKMLERFPGDAEVKLTIFHNLLEQGRLFGNYDIGAVREMYARGGLPRLIGITHKRYI